MIFLTQEIDFLGLKEGLVECATVCVKSEVILTKCFKNSNELFCTTRFMASDGLAAGPWYNYS